MAILNMCNTFISLRRAIQRSKKPAVGQWHLVIYVQVVFAVHMAQLKGTLMRKQPTSKSAQKLVLQEI